MIKLKSLAIENFRSYRSGAKVDFPDAGILYIAGPRSGSGKTSLLLGIYDALGACHVPGARLASRGSDAPRVSTLVFSKDGVDYEASRKKSFTLKVNGKGSTALPKEQEKELQRILTAQDADWVSQMTWIKQRRGSWFLDLADSDKKALIAKALGIVDLEDVEKRQAEIVKKAENEVWKLEIAVSEKKTSRDAIQPEDMEILEAAAKKAQKEHEALKAEMAVCEKELAKAKSAQARPCESADVLAARKDLKDLETQQKGVSAQLSADLAVVRAKKRDSAPSADMVELQKAKEAAQEEVNRQATVAQRGVAKQRELEDEVAELTKKAQQAAKAYNLRVQSYLTAQQRVSARAAVLEKIEKAKTDLAGCSAGQCPTCAQPWLGAAEAPIRAQIASLEKQLASLPVIDAEPPGEPPAETDSEPKKQQLALVRTKLAEVEAKLSATKANLGQIDKQVVELNGKEQAAFQQLLWLEGQVLEQEVQEKLAALREKAAVITAGIAKIESEWAKEEQQRVVALFVQASEKLAAVREKSVWIQVAVKDAETRVFLQKTRQKIEQELAELESTLGDLQKTLVAETEFAQLVGPKGYVGFVLDDALQRISARMNGWLARLPNVDDVSCEIKSSKVAKNGKESQTIHLVTRIAGQESSAWRDELSGGQVRAVELAVDMAVMSVLGEYTGCDYGWMCLDEPFDGLSATEIEPAMDLVREIAAEKLVLLIDHHVEVAVVCDRKLTVQFKNGESTLV